MWMLRESLPAPLYRVENTIRCARIISGYAHPDCDKVYVSADCADYRRHDQPL